MQSVRQQLSRRNAEISKDPGDCAALAGSLTDDVQPVVPRSLLSPAMFCPLWINWRARPGGRVD